MCPKQQFRQRKIPTKTQGGWLMPVAAFIVVVMGLLAAGMGRLSSQTSISTAQEQISLQTFYAAEAGAQLGLNQVFYDTASTVTRTTATNACSSFSGTTIVFNAPGMQNCQASITCLPRIDSGDTTTFFDISSSAQCGTAPVNALRVVDVSAFLQ